MSIVTLLAVLAALLFSSCAIHVEKRDAGNETTKSFNVDKFNGISVSGPGHVVFTVADTISVSVKANEGTIDRLEIFTSKDSLLHISLDDKLTHGFNINVADKNEFTVYVSGPSISAISVLGSGSFECKDSLATDNAVIYVAGSGEVDIRSYKAGSMTVNVAGSGDVDIKSATVQNDFAVAVKGSGDINVSSVTAATADCSVTGSGDIKTNLKNVTQSRFLITGSGDIDADLANCGTASVQISGSGDVKLSGTLNHLNQTISGSGEIDTRRLKVAVNN